MEKDNTSKIIYDIDPGYTWAGENKAIDAAGKTYKWSEYDPATTTDKLTYTPTRMAKTVFNTYDDGDNFDVLCYFTDWAQYDPRITFDDPQYYPQSGRSADIMRLDTPEGKPFKRLIYSFAGLVGDKKYDPAKLNADKASDLGIADSEENALDKHQGKPVPVDIYGAIQANINCGFTQWSDGSASELYYQDKAKGLLGGFRLLHDKHPDLEFSLSVGGWSMSGFFSELAKDPALRTNFVAGINDFFTRFPMFTHLDIDWEYPGTEGNGNIFDPQDGANFATLITEIKAANIPNLTGISIAASADPKKLALANIPALMAAGVNGINLMTYDFFTLGNGKLSHHTNLSRAADDEYSKFSIEDAVDYLISLNVDPKAIFIGYAGYTRNAKNAVLEEMNNPAEESMKGDYTNSPAGSVVGSFEGSVLEWTDIICHYMDFEAGVGRNGFTLIHDKIAKADYLYNAEAKLFLSLDTPRSVRDKAKYVKAKGLGGLFVWTGDQDNGLLTNAAHEGLGRRKKYDAIDMTPFYLDSEGELPTYTEPAEPECEACKSTQ
ncbi:MAG: chitinase [Enterobacteriaceae bacterium]|jgi:GH18 family chitinase|nr:chitinase [Enterobacteriaceae bacterium]